MLISVTNIFEASGQDGDSEMIKSFYSEIQDGCHSDHLLIRSASNEAKTKYIYGSYYMLLRMRVGILFYFFKIFFFLNICFSFKCCVCFIYLFTYLLDFVSYCPV